MKQVTYFHPALRLLHWLMALAIIAMLFMGVVMVSTVSSLHSQLISVHKPLGLVIFILILIRLSLRLYTLVPPLPSSVPVWQKLLSNLSHLALYIMMFAQPLIGWAMLSAAGYPVIISTGIVLPPIAPINNDLYVLLRSLHSVVAWLLFLTIMLHLAAALLHALVLRDGVFNSMAGFRKY
ncbi:TPA: cytochrome b/b6 domain-containing protein [Escherichia coli]|nr:cytochrome b/b6 domain-containing protein [Escherichia coli]HEL8044552.1 cytochrome b/b6 domain-containing protein [Escherichia coli]HEL8049330.1 cytochrome b/b6 domain-containing protein [Escherichia coli]HEL8054081.1 cytochrome b/b6 domain-containing protein [Escherichia coli]HEL8058931.1 cytochrome b/b6 domain-containing protein [Escherichia coli]